MVSGVLAEAYPIHQVCVAHQVCAPVQAGIRVDRCLQPAPLASFADFLSV